MESNEQEFYQELGQRLRESRLARGLTLEEASYSVSSRLKRPMCRQALSLIETGKQKITVFQLQELERLYKIRKGTLEKIDGMIDAEAKYYATLR